MNIQFYRDSSATQSVANLRVGTYWGVTVRDSFGEFRVLDSEQEELGKVYTSWNTTTFNINEGVPYDYFPIGDPEIISESSSNPWRECTKHRVYTIGGTYFEYAYYRRGTKEYIAFSYPRVRTGAGYLNISMFHNGNYFWNITGANSFPPLEINTDAYNLLGLAFFVGEMADTLNNTQEMIVPCVIVNSISDPDTNIILNPRRGFTSNVIQGFFSLPEYTPTNNNNNFGGRGDGSYRGTSPEVMDILARNRALSITSGNGNGLTYYYVNPTSFNQFLSFVYGTHLITSSEKIDSCLIDAIIIPTGYSPLLPNISRIFIANRTCVVDDSRIIINRLEGGVLGTAELQNSGYDDYNDFSNTTASLFLPFVGRIELDINSIARGYLRVEYIIDVFTGNIGYWVYTRGMNFPYEFLYGCYTGNCAIHVPMNGIHTHSQSVLGEVVNMATPIALGYLGAPTMQVGMSLVSSASGFLNRVNSPLISRAGSVDKSSAAIAPYQCRLDIERKDIIRTSSYGDVEGIPSFDTVKIRELNGFVKAHDARLDNLKCGDNEKEMVVELLRNGVYL